MSANSLRLPRGPNLQLCVKRENAESVAAFLVNGKTFEVLAYSHAQRAACRTSTDGSLLLMGSTSFLLRAGEAPRIAALLSASSPAAAEASA